MEHFEQINRQARLPLAQISADEGTGFEIAIDGDISRLVPVLGKGVAKVLHELHLPFFDDTPLGYRGDGGGNARGARGVGAGGHVHPVPCERSE